MKTVSDLQQLSAANSQLDNAQYQLGEQQRGRNAQADSRQSEQVGQIDQTSQQVAKYLSEGNQQAAAAALMNASMGQQDSKSSDLQTDRRSEVTNTLRTLMQQGTLTDEAVRQALYEKDVAATLKDAGMYDVLMHNETYSLQVNKRTR
jgi:transcriptional regulator of met regulon